MDVWKMALGKWRNVKDHHSNYEEHFPVADEQKVTRKIRRNLNRNDETTKNNVD